MSRRVCVKNDGVSRHNKLKALSISRRDTRDESVPAPDRMRVVRIALRLSLAAAFLSAVADRFG